MLSQAGDFLAFVGYVDAIFTLIGSVLLFFICVIVGVRRQITSGSLWIVAGFVIVLLAVIWFYFVSHSKTLATISGAFTVADIVT